MTHLVAFEFFSTKWVSGQGCSLKSVSDVTQIGDPTEIYWYCIKADKKPGEQKEGHWHHRSQEDSILKTNTFRLHLHYTFLVYKTIRGARAGTPALQAYRDMSNM